jgi:hypothetical protein
MATAIRDHGKAESQYGRNNREAPSSSPVDEVNGHPVDSCHCAEIERDTRNSASAADSNACRCGNSQLKQMKVKFEAKY